MPNSETPDDLSPQDLALIQRMIRHARNSVVDDLLAGNDTCCFTTAQYARRYNEKWAQFYPICDTAARVFLRSVGAVEVCPDVWTRKDT